MIQNNFYFRKVIISVVLFFLSFTLFLSTICPNLYWRDAGEFQVVAYQLGIAHPAGSPLYALAAKIFTFLPFGSIAFKVNLASAFFAAFLLAVTFLLIAECLDIVFSPNNKSVLVLSGTIAVSFLAVSNTLWCNAIQAEVYTLQNCFYRFDCPFSGPWFTKQRKKFTLCGRFTLWVECGRPYHHDPLYSGSFLVHLVILSKVFFSFKVRRSSNVCHLRGLGLSLSPG